jgi:hypothetical protein
MGKSSYRETKAGLGVLQKLQQVYSLVGLTTHAIVSIQKISKRSSKLRKKIKTCTSQFVIPPLMYWFSTQSIDLGSLIGGILCQGYGIGSQQQHCDQMDQIPKRNRLEALSTLQELQHQTCHRA